MSLAAAFVDAPALRAGPAGVGRRYVYQPASAPIELVFQLAPEFGPALVEDHLVEARILFHFPARMF